MHIERNMIYEEQLIVVFDRMDQVLRTKIILLVEVLRKDQSYDEVTLEREVDEQAQHPLLFNMVDK